MATQIKCMTIAECFNVATTMDRFKRRWLSDDTSVEGSQEAFPQLKNTGLNAGHGFRNIGEEGSTNNRETSLECHCRNNGAT